jgi:hypothetical protein
VTAQNRRLIGINFNQISLFKENKKAPAEYWLQNMKNMYGLSLANDFQFYGILQPHLYSSLTKEHFQLYGNDSFYHKYNEYYPNLIQKINNDSINYLYDFTKIFEKNYQEAFIDDCHLKEEYQKYVAVEVYKLIEDRLNKKE